jgi:uncharacterized protein (DUF362 family)
MNSGPVAITKYDQPLEPVREAIRLAGGLDRIHPSAKVFIKPNIVYWTTRVDFPKWGVITTSRLVNDVVRLLAQHGVSDLTIGEGMVLNRSEGRKISSHAFESLGYNKLARRYGVKVMDTFQRPFKEVDLGEGVRLGFNLDALESDLVVDLPVMKTHAQSVVSLGLKNLKGLLDMKSRKRCHSADPEKDLHFHIARLNKAMPPILTVIDGTFSLEYGPAFDGAAHRRDLLVASWDILAADMTGAGLLGHPPQSVPHLVHAAAAQGRSLELADLQLKGEDLSEHVKTHRWKVPYNQDRTLPLALEKKGITGLAYHEYDSSLCTYCSAMNGVVLRAIAGAWQGRPWDKVEVLTGKMMKPDPEARRTILFGKCMCRAHQDNPDIRRMIPVKGCPPSPGQIVKALHQAGIMADDGLFADLDSLPGAFMKYYRDRPEFEEGMFTIP